MSRGMNVAIILTCQVCASSDTLGRAVKYWHLSLIWIVRHPPWSMPVKRTRAKGQQLPSHFLKTPYEWMLQNLWLFSDKGIGRTLGGALWAAVFRQKSGLHPVEVAQRCLDICYPVHQLPQLVSLPPTHPLPLLHSCLLVQTRASFASIWPLCWWLNLWLTLLLILPVLSVYSQREPPPILSPSFFFF